MKHDPLLHSLIESTRIPMPRIYQPWFWIVSESDVEAKPAPTIADIQRSVSRHYGITVADMISERRTAGVINPRQVAMYLTKTLRLDSLPKIGRHFGARNHTTVLHAVRKIEASKGNPEIRDAIEAIRQELGT